MKENLKLMFLLVNKISQSLNTKNSLDAGIQDKKHEYLDSGQICLMIIELNA